MKDKGRMERPSGVQPSEWEDRVERAGIRARINSLASEDEGLPSAQTAIHSPPRTTARTSYVTSGRDQTKSGTYVGPTLADNGYLEAEVGKI
jgi:hypothetical protein